MKTTTQGKLGKKWEEVRERLAKKDPGTWILALVAVVGMPIAIYVGLRSVGWLVKAAGGTAIEAETGTLAGPVTVKSDSQAAGGQYLEFVSAAAFQPSAPYYATFYYPWYKSLAIDGSWSYWPDHSNNPPTKWFAHYLPDVDTSGFSPSSELYSSNDYNVFKWQVAKMAEAKQEVAISSWWGQGHKTDTAFRNIITDYMGRADNPYPNLRWALYYECEGSASSACGGTSNPSVSKIVSDLNYIGANYAGAPGILKINGKPVMFVFGDSSDVANTGSCTDQANSAVTARWTQANAQASTRFYIVLKVFSGYKTDPCQPDSWHQYAPAVRNDSQLPYAYMVSPGFWLDDGVAGVRLCRNLNGAAVVGCSSDNLALSVPSFSSVVGSMVAANATWKLTETWNEWGEGSSVEPGDQSLIDATGNEILDPAGVPFKNQYIDALNQQLPALEAGTGR